MIKVNIHRSIASEARSFEEQALRDNAAAILPYTPLAKIRAGKVAAYYLEKDSKGDPSRLAVLIDDGSFVNILLFALNGIYMFGGFVPLDNLESLTITEVVTSGFYELEAAIAGETITLAFDAQTNAYSPKTNMSEVVHAAFAKRIAA
ncbi:hypothetical protein CQ12_33395 [Bradyrhizobium jicamae]|uniref:Uncharacterized protein n=1 Tax=Bradyrhizobium jicamae TaxID=280332 RepID=A0A0R3LMD3_9BRAD|nr:hypothetical protein [Bradyrhizobium jicamae]KRR06352.1 hypothetical protein CQ12_33395 [Bradyrhizobium jicamae]